MFTSICSGGCVLNICVMFICCNRFDIAFGCYDFFSFNYVFEQSSYDYITSSVPKKMTTSYLIDYNIITGGHMSSTNFIVAI